MTAVVEVDGTVAGGAVLVVAADVVDANDDVLVLIAAVDETGATEVLDPHAARTSAPEIADRTARSAEAAKARGGAEEPIVFTLANRLFAQKGMQFRAPFLSL